MIRYCSFMADRRKLLPEERFARKPIVRRLSSWIAILLGVLAISGVTVVQVVAWLQPGLDPADVNVTDSSYAGGWGPDRRTYTMTTPAKYAVFNSITDNPNYGDERNFVTTKLSSHAGAGAGKTYSKSQPVTEFPSGAITRTRRPTISPTPLRPGCRERGPSRVTRPRKTMSQGCG